MAYVEKGDYVLIKSKEFFENEDELTELTEMFANQVVKVIGVSDDVNEWGEYTYDTLHDKLGRCTFTDHEIEMVYGK